MRVELLEVQENVQQSTMKVISTPAHATDTVFKQCEYFQKKHTQALVRFSTGGLRGPATGNHWRSNQQPTGPRRQIVLPPEK